MDEHVTCEICQLKMWHPFTYVLFPPSLATGTHVPRSDPDTQAGLWAHILQELPSGLV